MIVRRRALLAAYGGALIAFALMLPIRQFLTHERVPGGAYVTAADTTPLYEDDRIVSMRERADAMARAQLWREPETPISRVRFGADSSTPSNVECRFRFSDLGGTTPKFNCLLESGKELRIKYGPGAEIPVEAAATRLLTALGFGADTVTLVERVRCFECPDAPFETSKVVEATGTQPLYEKVADTEDYEDFEWVSVEQKFAARPIESGPKARNVVSRFCCSRTSARHSARAASI
jgi:hypothetical protein